MFNIFTPKYICDIYKNLLNKKGAAKRSAYTVFNFSLLHFG